MKTLSIRDFRTRPRQARETLRDEHEALLTVSGKPFALMIAVDAESIDETLDALRRARAQQAVRAIRRDARRRGLDRLGHEQIEAIIARTRSERRSTD